MRRGLGVIALCLALAACLPAGDGGGGADVDPTAAPDAPIAGPDQTRPGLRPGGSAAKPASSAALEPPAPQRTPDAMDDLLPQPEPEPVAKEGTAAEPPPAGPAPLVEEKAPPPVPAALQTQKRQCERHKGNFVRRGGDTGIFVCVRPTRDANKGCDDNADCEGVCFARSRSCAPADPLFGCYDTLEAGRVVKICNE